MVDELLEYLLWPAAQMGIIAALTELVKQTFMIKKELIPLIALGLGIICGTYVYGIVSKYGILKGVLLGVALGLASTGLFEFSKQMVKSDTNNKTLK